MLPSAETQLADRIFTLLEREVARSEGIANPPFPLTKSIKDLSMAYDALIRR